MKEILLASLILLAALPSARPDTIAQWNFNSDPPDANVSTGVTTPSIGVGALTLVGGTTAVFVTGDPAQDPAGSTDNSGWNTKSYPAATANNKTAGIRVDVDTTAYDHISIRWSQQNSPSASRYARVQYTVDGVNFTDADVVVIVPEGVFTNQSVNLDSVPGVANNPNFGLQIVSEFESTATLSGSAAYLATKTNTAYSSAGTMRFDMLTVSGTVIPGANTPPYISSITNQTIRVNQSTGPLPFTIGDAQDPAGSLALSQSSSNPGVIPEASIHLAGSGSNRTVTIDAASQTGFSTIALDVIDTGGRSNRTTFTVTVLPLNTAPVISPLAAAHTLMSSATTGISFTIGDLETPAGSLSLSGHSANTGLVPDSNIVFGGSGSNRTVTLTPASGQTGVTPVTITVSDGTNAANAVFPLMVVPSAAVIFYDPFTYADGSLLTNSGFLWSTRSGTVGECQTISGQLQVSASQTEDVAGPLIGTPYGVSNSTVLYSSFKMNFLDLPKRTPAYFAHFAGGGALRGRIYAGTPTNALPGAFRLYVANASDTNAVPAADLNTNVTYALVTRYDLDSATTTLWINPAAESDPGTTATDPQTAVAISAYDFRQDASLGATLLVDDLKVGLSFAAVTSAAASVNPIPLNARRLGANIILTWTNPSFVLQSASQPSGVYSAMPGTASPFTNTISGPAKFFRLKAN